MTRDNAATTHSYKDWALTPEQLTQLLDAADTTRRRAILHLAGIWGLRASEIGHFSSTWLSTQGGNIRIPGRCTCPTCKQPNTTAWTPKTPAGRRTLPVNLHPRTYAILRQYIGKYPHNKIQISRRTVWYHVRKAADQANLDNRVSPHILRATAATMLADMGLNPHQLMSIMGWARQDMATTYVAEAAINSRRALEDKDLKWWI